METPLPSDVIANSVTKDDYPKDSPSKRGVVMDFFIPSSAIYRNLNLPATPPPYWSHRRDFVLQSTIYAESMWATAVYIATSRQTSMSWRVRGQSLKARRMHEILHNSDAGDGWVAFLSRHYRDFTLTDNGGFIEIVRSSSARGSRLEGLVHLDSTRCTRTGNPDIPVVYEDRKSRYHELKDYQVIMISDMPDPGDLWYGVGLSAATRAYPSIYNLYAIETYVGEKVTGRKALAIHFVNGVNVSQLQSAFEEGQAAEDALGYVAQMGAIIIPNIDPSATPGVATVQLAGLPEHFDPNQERRKCYLIYANALGLDPQDIDPQLLASKSLGTGAQSRVIDDKASGRGGMSWRQQFTHQMNEKVMPEKILWEFIEKDYRDLLQQAQLEHMRTVTNVNRVQAGLLSPSQANNLLVDLEDISKEYLLESDLTDVEDWTDTNMPDMVPDKEIKGKPHNLLPDANNPNSEAGQATRATYSVPDRTASKARLVNEVSSLLEDVGYAVED